MRRFAAAGGVLTPIATSARWVIVRLAFPISLPCLMAGRTADCPGVVGAASALIGTGSILVAALMGFLEQRLGSEACAGRQGVVSDVPLAA